MAQKPTQAGTNQRGIWTQTKGTHDASIDGPVEITVRDIHRNSQGNGRSMGLNTHMKNAEKTKLATAIFKALPMDKVSDKVAKPDATEAIKAIAGCLNSRNGKWRKTVPSRSCQESQLLWRLVKFHGGNGNLWGFPWFADHDTRERMDTLAQVMRNGHSSAADAWRKAMHG